MSEIPEKFSFEFYDVNRVRDIEETGKRMMKIITNNVPRPMLSFMELTEEEQKEFDYLDEDDRGNLRFVRYAGEVYDIGEFQVIDQSLRPSDQPFTGWSGVQPDSYFSGVLVKYAPEEWEHVIIGRYSA